MSASHKTPFGPALNSFSDGKIDDAFSMIGKTLPCHVVAVAGGIVTVQFDIVSGYTLPQIVVPVGGSEYYRIPIQVGCLGVVVAISARIGNVSGLGPQNPADLNQGANLTSLVFMPIGNVNWWAKPGNQAVVYGPNGVLLSNQIPNGSPPPQWAMDTFINLTTVNIVLSVANGATTVTLTSTVIAIKGDVTVTGKITATGDIKAGTVSLETHIHSASGGTGNGGPPVP